MAYQDSIVPKVEEIKETSSQKCFSTCCIEKCEKKDWDAPALLNSMSGFAWPLTVVIVFTFKSQIVDLMKKISRIEAFGGQAEFKNDVKEFDKSVQEAATHVSTPVTDGAEVTKVSELNQSIESDFDQIIRLSAEDPQLGMMKLAALIEKDVRSLLAVQGLLKGSKNKVNLSEMFSILD